MNETVETKGRGTGAKAAKAVGAVVLAACLIASLGLNIYQASAAAAQNQKVNSFIDGQLERQAKEEEQENTYQEDGFKVGGEYEIRSTTHISDAYKSGDESQLSEADKDTLEMAKAVLDEVIEDGMSSYEQELAVYTWMVENIGGSGSGGVISRPGGTTDAFTPHDVLTSKSAVCVGYATTFRLLMNMLGMDVHIVHNEYHSWDLVEVEKDQWYHVDVYSDAHGAKFGNFNMTDAVCQMGHSWDGSALPVADSVKYSPAVQNSVELDSLTDVPAQFKQDMDEGRYAMYYRFKTPLSDEEMSAADFMVSRIDSALENVMEEWYYFQAAWYPGEGDETILGLSLEMDEESDENSGFDAESPEGKALVQAIAEAFGIDPAQLGGGDDDPEAGGGYPIDDVTNAPAAEAGEIVTWNGGGSVAID